jgi:uncharacterized membrane protein
MEPVRRPSVISSWDLLPAAGLAALTFFYTWVTPRLPDPVPTHFDAAGHVNGWTAKAHFPWLIFGIPLFVWLALLVTGWGLSMTQKGPARARVAAVQPLRGTLGLGVTLLMMGGLAIPVYGIACIHVAVAALVACLIAGIVFTARETKELLGHQPDARHYRWGVIYANPDDPRLWVEKRLGVGWTLNYAHPSAWWMTLLLLLPVILVLGVVFVLKK